MAPKLMMPNVCMFLCVCVLVCVCVCVCVNIHIYIGISRKLKMTKRQAKSFAEEQRDKTAKNDVFMLVGRYFRV